jgi:hypothetical protein
MLIYLLLGELEWQDIRFLNYKNNTHNIIILKQNIIHNTNFPAILRNYLQMIFNLEFNEKPDYLHYIDLFKREI